ncbi:MAG: FAD-dependent oxidoreductase, partial [Candidatus Omnitrophota bacterium]
MLQSEVVSIRHDGRKVLEVFYKDTRTGKVAGVQGSDFCSSMPLTQLVFLMDPAPPQDILDACRRLRYRSLVMVNCIAARKAVSSDNWIYVNSSDVKVARIQNFKNWSSDMLPDHEKTSLGLEYFCDEGDEIWSMADKALLALGGRELEQLKLCRGNEIVDGCVVRAAKTYPVYEKGYLRPLAAIREFVSGFSNLHCMGRYGIFRYNGMDHSVLTGLLAAENVLGKKHDLWRVNVETWDD